MIMLLGTLLCSCNTTPTKVENPKEVTTVELQQLASIDSTCYRVVEKDDTVYVLSTTDNTVVKQVHNHSGIVDTLLLTIFIIMIIMWIWLLIIK